MPKKFTLLCHFNFYGRIFVFLLEFKSACHYIFIVPPLWNDRFTYVERSYHNCGTIVSPG